MTDTERRSAKEWVGDQIAAGSRELFVEILPPTALQRSGVDFLPDEQIARRVRLSKIQKHATWMEPTAAAVGLSLFGPLGLLAYFGPRLASYAAEKRARSHGGVVRPITTAERDQSKAVKAKRRVR